jgi:hypothetical protein
VLVILLLIWIGVEAHYAGCVARAEAITPEIQRLPSVQQQLGGAAVPSNGARLGAVSGCSRLPF